MPKHFYSVKETAKILGVSTNTVYKYLDEGSLKGKRLNNRGRFKIPFSEVAPYLASETSTTAPVETPVTKNVFGSFFLASLIGLILVFLLWNFGQGAAGFQLSLTRDIGNAILGYSNRTFSGFGSLVSRFLPDVQQFANKTQHQNEIVSDPSVRIVQEEKAPDLSYKIENTEGRTNELYANVQVLASRTQRLLSKSRTLTSAELNNAIEEMSQLLGSLSDSSDKKTIFAEINWLNENWDFTNIEALKRAASNASNFLVSLQGQSQAAFTRPEITVLNNLVIETDRLQELVGNPSDLPSGKTLYGNIKGVEILAQTIDAKVGEIDKILGSWESYDISEKENTIKSILSDTSSINVLPKVDEVVFSKSLSQDRDAELKNILFSVKGILTANKTRLAQKADEPVVVTWPEWDGAVFKTLIINPSAKAPQEVAYKYYLPPDVKRGDVEQTEAGLTLNFDSQKNQYFMEVNLFLSAGEVKTLSLKKTGGQKISAVLGTEIDKPLAENVVPETNIAKTIPEFPGLTVFREKVAGLTAEIPWEKMAVFGLIIFLSGLITLIVYLTMTFFLKVLSQVINFFVAVITSLTTLITKTTNAVKTFFAKIGSVITKALFSVVTAILRAFRAIVQATLTFAAKIISAARKTVVTIGNSLLKIPVAILTFFLKALSSITKTMASIINKVFTVLVSITKFTDSALVRLNFGTPTIRKPRRDLRVAAVFLLVGLAAALISASTALVVAAQVERSQQAALEEKEVTRLE